MSFRLKVILLAFIFTLAQVIICIFIAPGESIAQKYQALCTWDCGWYTSITAEGYHSVIPPVAQNGKLSNVAFFPAFPYMARAIHLISSLRAEISLLLVSQMNCFIFWVLFLCLMQTWKFSSFVKYFCILSVISFPTAFIFVTGYSESLFAASILGYIFFSQKRESKFSVYAALSGFIMTSTRIVGLSCIPYPIILHGIGKRKHLSQLLLILITSLMGVMSFFIYCKIKFGVYDLYLQTQKVGWGQQFIPTALLNWKNLPFRFSWDYYGLQISVGLFFLLAFLEFLLVIEHFSTRKVSRLHLRLPIYFCALTLFFIHYSGVANVGFISFIRYAFIWYVLLMLLLAHALMDLNLENIRYKNLSRAFLVFFASIFSYYHFKMQLFYLHHFLNHVWFV